MMESTLHVTSTGVISWSHMFQLVCWAILDLEPSVFPFAVLSHAVPILLVVLFHRQEWPEEDCFGFIRLEPVARSFPWQCLRLSMKCCSSAIVISLEGGAQGGLKSVG